MTIVKLTNVGFIGLAVFCTLALLSGLTVQAALAPAPVGVVDYDRLMMRHPDMPQANAALQAETEQANKELVAQADKLGDKEKQDLVARLEQRVELKRQSLMIAIAAKVDAAVKETATAKGLSVVLQKDMVVYGGLDITEEVLRKISGI